MKYLYILLIFMLVFSGCKSKEDSTNGERVDKKQALTPFTIPGIGDTDNLIVQDVDIITKPDGSISFASHISGNLFTNKDEEFITVDIPDGYGVKKVKGVKKSNNISITFYIDPSDDTQVATCIVDPSDEICDLGLWEPRKLSNLGNSPYLKKIGENIFYLTENELVQKSSITGLSNSISFATIPTGYVSQIAINDNGAIMVDNGTEISISDSFDMVVPDLEQVSNSDYMAELSPNVNKFFFPHKEGFLVKGGIRNDFYRISDSSGDIDIRFAQHHAYDQYINVGGGFNRIFNNSNLSNCTSHIVGGDDIMICGSKVYNLGDVSNDIKEVDFWSYGIISGTERNILSDDNFLYVYSSSINEGEFLARIDLDIMDHFDIFDRNGTSYKINSASISGNTYMACTDSSILRINTIDATPDIIETIGECDQIVSF